ncbi:MAG: hypothetical protein LBS70_06920, partial [Candidatus Accumulibacter sp.]|nr:hypothetical protein [Accumulibacter sp.]
MTKYLESRRAKFAEAQRAVPKPAPGAPNPSFFSVLSVSSVVNPPSLPPQQRVVFLAAAQQGEA